MLIRIIEVLQSTYKAGNLQITEQLSFLSLLMARFNVNCGEYFNILFSHVLMCTSGVQSLLLLS